jgi:hypothetical protein
MEAEKETRLHDRELATDYGGPCYEVFDEYRLWPALLDKLGSQFEFRLKQIALHDRTGKLVSVPQIRTNSILASILSDLVLSRKVSLLSGFVTPLFTILTFSSETIEDYRIAKTKLKARIEDVLGFYSAHSPFYPSDKGTILLLYLPLGYQAMASTSLKIYKKIFDKLKADFVSPSVRVCVIQLFDPSPEVAADLLLENADALGSFDSQLVKFFDTFRELLAQTFHDRSIAYEESLKAVMASGIVDDIALSKLILAKESNAFFHQQFGLTVCFTSRQCDLVLLRINLWLYMTNLKPLLTKISKK